jgi:NAD(P)-dependent dehydrogenase (short-subunit alcohol dehydrogenase family)
MKNIVITGTSRGIGLEMALQLANLGHQILALSRSAHPSLLAHKNVSCLLVDLSVESDLQQVTNFLNNNWKTVAAVVHNAGALLLKPFAETSMSDFESIYRVNVFGVANLTRVVLPFLEQGSHVVGVSSMGGIQGSTKFAGLSAYSSSKGALITLFELLAEEFKERQISFNVLALGAVNTEMLAEAFPGYQANLSAAEMANYIADFALNGNKFFNGKTLQVSNSTP